MTRAEQLLITRKLLLGERGWILHDGEGDPTGNRRIQPLLWGTVELGRRPRYWEKGGVNWIWDDVGDGTIMAYRFTD